MSVPRFWVSRSRAAADVSSGDRRSTRSRTLAAALAFGLGLSAGGCTESPREAERRHPDTGRWYSASQVAVGGKVFALHCAGCHGAAAEGAENWFRRLPDGRWPPPPLNGTAHAWHHPLWQLRDHIRAGSDPAHGNMPGFAGVLSDAEVDATIAWFQSHWPDEVYAAWRVYDANTPIP